LKYAIINQQSSIKEIVRPSLHHALLYTGTNLLLVLKKKMNQELLNQNCNGHNTIHLGTRQTTVTITSVNAFSFKAHIATHYKGNSG
jgi:hypothetical protein